MKKLIYTKLGKLRIWLILKLAQKDLQILANLTIDGTVFCFEGVGVIHNSNLYNTFAFEEGCVACMSKEDIENRFKNQGEELIHTRNGKVINRFCSK